MQVCSPDTITVLTKSSLLQPWPELSLNLDALQNIGREKSKPSRDGKFQQWSSAEVK